MTVLFRCRIEKPLLNKANRVARRLGTSTSEMVRIFVTQMARTGKVPLKLDATNPDDSIPGPWEQRAATLESFYDKSKAW
jgi:antitoxin component of RelBE/YafQ-DinJ toxin-antitoxin module